MERLPSVIDPAKFCDEALKLRHSMQKLHWMGLDREAERLVRETGKPEQDGPAIVAPLALDMH